MGTNYYMTVDACPHCGRGRDELHIGKSSAGWVFSLNTHPDDGITGLDDWREAWKRNPIRNEYGDAVKPEEMERTITARKTGLRRHDIDGRFCIAHGEGTYDLMRGEFS